MRSDARVPLMRREWLSILACLAISLATPLCATSQLPTQAVQSELRLDGIVARNSAVDAGYGLSIPAGIYVRTGVVAGLGVGRHGVDGRTDLIARFSLDPFRQSSWAPYGGAGLTGRYRPEADGGSRGYLLVFMGVEGPVAAGRTSGWVPAFEVGLGGGARFGFVMRRGVAGRR
jgi:hypothetical protein